MIAVSRVATPAARRTGRPALLEAVGRGAAGDQAGADRERVDAMLARPEQFPLVYVEMEPGDTLFFDANMLHRSDQNTSDNPRWSMICCYNAARNDP